MWENCSRSTTPNEVFRYLILQHFTLSQVEADVKFKPRLNRIKDGSGSAPAPSLSPDSRLKPNVIRARINQQSNTRSAQTYTRRLQRRRRTELRFRTWPDLEPALQTKPRHRCVVLSLYSQTKPDLISHTSRTSSSTEPSRSSNM